MQKVHKNEVAESSGQALGDFRICVGLHRFAVRIIIDNDNCA